MNTEIFTLIAKSPHCANRQFLLASYGNASTMSVLHTMYEEMM